jgi:RNA polymerase-binding transcription factor DksA
MYVKEKDFQHFSIYCTKIANNQQNTYEVQQQGKKNKKDKKKRESREHECDRAPADHTTLDHAELQRNRTLILALAAEPRKQFISTEKHEYLLKEGRYFTCKQKGHMRNDCPNKPATDMNNVDDAKCKLEKIIGKEEP